MIYTRVSSSENKAELDAQAERLRQYALAKGYRIREVIKEIGSGLNDNRRRLQKLLRDGKATKILVEHKDRLTRFGFNYLKTLLANQGCEIEVVNESKEDKKRTYGRLNKDYNIILRTLLWIKEEQEED